MPDFLGKRTFLTPDFLGKRTFLAKIHYLCAVKSVRYAVQEDC